MNLPPIYKTDHTMSKPNPKPNEDMFGLGIQVFKIQSKNTQSNNKQPRQAIKQIQNPKQPPKPKKVSGRLPALSSTANQQQEEHLPQTVDQLSRKSIERRQLSTNQKPPHKEMKRDQSFLNKRIAEKKIINRSLQVKEKKKSEPTLTKVLPNKELNHLIQFYESRRNSFTSEREEMFYVNEDHYDPFSLDNFMRREGHFHYKPYEDHDVNI